MGLWVEHSKDDMLPMWLKNGLSSKCQYCGNEMLDYYNDDYRCTNRKCSNPTCPGIIAARADFVIKILNIKGIGFAKCLEAVRSSGIRDQIELLKIFGIHPTVTLFTYLRMHCFNGVDGEWEKICKKLDIYSLDELFDAYDGKYKELLVENKELLYRDVEFVSLVERPVDRKVSRPAQYLTVMITGTPIGYETKEHFIDTINTCMQGIIVVIHQKTKRQSGVDYLIREPGSTTRGKVEAAMRGGIPIVTSQEFMAILVNMLRKIEDENEVILASYSSEEKE